MIRLSYISRFGNNLDKLDIADIEVVSDFNNSRKGITGVLITFGELFYQVLEGDRDVVMALYERIANDERHKDIIKLSEEETTYRQYPEWGMKHIDVSDDTQALLTPFKEILQNLSQNSSQLADTHRLLRSYLQPAALQMMKNGVSAFENRSCKSEKVILFSDLVSFSKLTQHFHDEDIIETINVYFNIAATTVKKFGGEVNKFIGDGFLAYFDGDKSEDALLASLEISQKLTELRETSAESTPQHYLFAGFGLDRGWVIEGNLGSELKRDFTIIGEAVNTAARVERLSRYHNHAILFTSRIQETLNSNWNTVSIGTPVLKGFETHQEIFGLRNENARVPVVAEQISAAIAQYVHSFSKQQRSYQYI